jgi:TatD DNase family protein
MSPDHLPLVDSHCHLTWPDFDADLDGVIERMRAAGVERAICVATDPRSAARALEIAGQYACVSATAGLHPNDLSESWRDDLVALEPSLRDGRAIAVGETGLDYYRDWVPHERQRMAFARHAHLARELDVPLIVHIRDQDGRWGAYDDVAAILQETQCTRGVIHCYTGDVAHVASYLALGFYVSFSGIVTFKSAENVRAAALATPLERTLVETDAPFLSPEPNRKVKRCEPAFVVHTARRLAELKDVEFATLARSTTENVRSLFKLSAPRSA